MRENSQDIENKQFLHFWTKRRFIYSVICKISADQMPKCLIKLVISVLKIFPDSFQMAGLVLTAWYRQ